MIMKRIFLFWIVSLFLLTGCETESDEWVDVGYKSLRIQMFFQADETKSYTAFFNDQEISMQPGPGNSKLFQVPDTVGVLKVFNNNEPTPELEVIINVGTIYLIQLPGQPVTLYEEEDFIKFSALISLFEGYKAVFYGQEILQGENYIRKDNTTGDLEFYGEEGTTPVDTIEDVTLTEGENLIILQTSETEFVQLSGGDTEEPEPEGDHLSKVRFFYTPAGKLNVDSIRLNIFAFNPMTGSDFIWDYKSVVVKKGELSPYIELDATLFKDYNSRAGFAYSISNAETDEIIDDGMSAANTFSINKDQDYFKALYKFATRQILNKQPGYPSQIVEGLSEKWETEIPTE